MFSYCWGHKITLHIIYLFISHVIMTFYKHCLSKDDTLSLYVLGLVTLPALNLGAYFICNLFSDFK